MNKLIYFAKNMNIGGVEKALLNRLNRTDFSKNEVTLVLEEKTGELLSALDDRIRVEEYTLSICPFVPLRKAFNFTKRMLWKFRYGGKYDSSCSFCTYSVIGSRLAQYASRSSELWIHNNYSAIYPSINDFKAFFDDLHIHGFDKLVFVSNEALDSFTAIYPELKGKCRVEANMVNKDEILRLANEPLEHEVSGGLTTFIYIGRLEETQKKITRMLEAFRTAREKRDDIRLWLVGDGPDRSTYEKLTSGMNIDSDVTFFGSQINPYKYLKAADCLLLTSDYEGFPVVYQEALLLGKTIITTVPTSNDEIDIREHAAVCSRDPASIAEAIICFGEK